MTATGIEAAIDRNRAALLAVVAELFAYAGLEEDGSGQCGEGGAATLARILRNAILRLLLPAESAARRLIMVAAKSLPLPRIALLPRLPAKSVDAARAAEPSPPDDPSPGSARIPSFRLFDPLKRFDAPRRNTAPGMPSISLPGIFERAPLPAKPSPGDPVDATGLNRRLIALKHALDDLPRQAARLSRIRASAAARQRAEIPAGPERRTRAVRVTGIRPGEPPGHRKRPRHAVDGLLAECHALWREAGAGHNTS